jgi:O-acetyl-ADP-ribose deacetylase (regulator of RNase III)
MDHPDGPSVSAAIRRAEGEELARDVARLGPIEPGRAVVTPARRLPCKWIIHAAVVERTEAGHISSAATIREAVRSALRLASGLGLSSIAFPAFAVRAAQVPRELASQVMVEELVAGLSERTTLRRVVVALKDPEAFLAFFEAALRRVTTQAEPLRLRVARQGDALAWSFEDAQAAVQRLHVRPFPARAEAELAAIVGRLRRAEGRRLLDGRRELEALGARVRALVPEDMLRRAGEVAGRAVVLRLDEGLAGVPFELAWDGERFLLERARVARRLVTHATSAAVALSQAGPYASPRFAPPPAPPGTPLSALVIAPSARDLPGAAREARAIVDLLWRRAGDRVDLLLLAGRRATRRAVLEALPRAALVHWCGHTRDAQGGPGWTLGAGEELVEADLLEAGLGARLVVANTCGVDDGARMARALLLAGAKNVVASLWEVEDGAAERFGLRLHEELARGATLGEALDAARAAAREVDPLHWGAWVHWGDPRERVVEPRGLSL